MNHFTLRHEISLKGMRRLIRGETETCSLSLTHKHCLVTIVSKTCMVFYTLSSECSSFSLYVENFNHERSEP